jgi:hypothetical protein
MKLIESKTLASAAASIEFTSIPQTFTDLVLVASLRSTAASTVEQVRININGSASNFTKRALQGSGSAVSSFSGSDSQMGYMASGNDTANTFGNLSIYFPNYTGSTFKSISADTTDENNATEAFQILMASLWSQTTAISSLSIYPQNGNLAIGSMVSLYGILKGSDGIVTTS